MRLQSSSIECMRIHVVSFSPLLEAVKTLKKSRKTMATLNMASLPDIYIYIHFVLMPNMELQMQLPFIIISFDSEIDRDRLLEKDPMGSE